MQNPFFQSREAVFYNQRLKYYPTRNGEKITAVICNDPKNPNFILYLVEKFCDNLGGVSKVSAALASALNYFFGDDDRGRAAECPQ